MLVSYKELLQDAREKGYGIPAYNNLNYETIRIQLEAATEARQPVILMLYPGMTNYISMEDFVAIGKHLAAKTPVPVCLHLDHSYDEDELYFAMRAGFSSVMYDCSKLSDEENSKKLSALCKVAHGMGVDVEAEVGHVGSGANAAEFKDASLYTKPEQLTWYLENTPVDALAVAIGNSHGVYVETPHLDIDRLNALNKLSRVPLVLHGTSLIPDDQVKAAILGGVTKVNIFTEFVQAYTDSIRRQFADPKASYMGQLIQTRKDIMEYLLAKFQVLNPKGIKVV